MPADRPLPPDPWQVSMMGSTAYILLDADGTPLATVYQRDDGVDERIAQTICLAPALLRENARLRETLRDAYRRLFIEDPDEMTPRDYRDLENRLRAALEAGGAAEAEAGGK